MSNGYHSGFNTGFNTNEAVNYTTDFWLSKMTQQRFCKCQKNNVKINPFFFYKNLLLSENFEAHYQKNSHFLKLERQLKRIDSKEVEQINKGRLFCLILWFFAHKFASKLILKDLEKDKKKVMKSRKRRLIRKMRKDNKKRKKTSVKKSTSST